MTCNCIETMNGLLLDRNARLSLTISWGSGLAFPTILAEKIDTKKRGGSTPVVVPTYCPFCGLKYEKKDAAA